MCFIEKEGMTAFFAFFVTSAEKALHRGGDRTAGILPYSQRSAKVLLRFGGDTLLRALCAKIP